MDTRLFYRLVDECADHSVQQISPYFNAEPLTDPRIYDFLDYIRRRSPAIAIELSTTPKYLNNKVIDRLLASPITELRISSMGVRREDYARLMPGVDFDHAMRSFEYLSNALLRRRTEYPRVQVVTLDSLLDDDGERASGTFWQTLGIPVRRWAVTSRAGNVRAPSMQIRCRSMVGCRSARNTHWMSVLSDGRAVLCCMDWRAEVVLGSTESSSIAAVWNGVEYARVRELTTSGKPMPVDFLCSRCEWAIPGDAGAAGHGNVEQPVWKGDDREK